MAKYFSAIALLAVIAIYGLIYLACADNACTQMVQEMQGPDAASIMQKYKDKLNNSPFAKMGLEEIGSKVKVEGGCEVYKRAIDSLALGYEVPMTERKIEAVLLYEEADGKKCANSN